MRHVAIVARLLLGLPFAVFGLNTLLWALGATPFVEPPAEMPAAAAAFQDALTATGFMHPLRGFAELTSGLLLLTGFLAPLGLVVLAPILVHVLLYHHFLDPTGIGFSWFLAALWLLVAFAHARSFRGLLEPFAKNRWVTDRGR